MFSVPTANNQAASNMMSPKRSMQRPQNNLPQAGGKAAVPMVKKNQMNKPNTSVQANQQNDLNGSVHFVVNVLLSLCAIVGGSLCL